MPTIQIKYSPTTGHQPTGLLEGQLAINIADNILFWIDSGSVLRSFAFLNPVAPTLGASDSSDKVATTAFVQGLIAALLGNAPTGLSTLGEIAASINNDPDFFGSINNAIISMIRYDEAQTLTGPQLAQVQTNIGLAAATLDGGTF